MPAICTFYGIVISMYFNDHLPPHIHARYGEYQAQILIADGSVLDGELPIRAEQLVKEWVQINKSALENQWKTQRIQQLPPLK